MPPADHDTDHDVCWPGMYGLVIPDHRQLEVDGMGQQFEHGTKAFNKPPDDLTLREWAAGTMGISQIAPVGGPCFLGGWFATRSIMVCQAGRRSPMRNKQDKTDDVFYYKAGDESQWHFWVERTDGSTKQQGAAFNVARFKTVLTKQVNACVDLACERVRIGNFESVVAWTTHVIAKESEAAHWEFKYLTLSFDLDILRFMMKAMRDAVEKKERALKKHTTTRVSRRVPQLKRGRSQDNLRPKNAEETAVAPEPKRSHSSP
jgi:hypothetical protein